MRRLNIKFPKLPQINPETKMLIKLALKGFTLSIFMTSVISTLIGAAAYFLNNSFWGWFFIAFATQFLLAALLTPIINTRRKIKISEIQAIQDLAEAQQTLDLKCSYCPEINRVPILFNQDNYFTCTDCDSQNLVTIQFSTARVTDPLYEKPKDEN